ncbi:hypothetical protein niasHT_033655 [Heterodera trifolii]|uniref:14-3-3 domain-containing protein n=1 Tax=Heterodera trifolii TaxID=157864 RepID=A0ABD2IMW7_9BILA
MKSKAYNFFTEDTYPARSFFQVVKLPKGAYRTRSYTAWGQYTENVTNTVLQKRMTMNNFEAVERKFDLLNIVQDNYYQTSDEWTDDLRGRPNGSTLLYNYYCIMFAERVTKDQLICLINVCEKARRFDDMVEAMKKLIKLDPNLGLEDRVSLSLAYKGATSPLRSSCRVLMSTEKRTGPGMNERQHQVLLSYRANVRNELVTICQKLLLPYSIVHCVGTVHGKCHKNGAAEADNTNNFEAVLRGTRLRFPNVTPPPFAEFIRANVWTADDARRYSMRDVLAWIEQHIDELIDDTTASRHDTTTATTTRNRGSRQGSRTGS